MRCFVAIPLPDDVLDKLGGLQAIIPVGRITPRENLHLTLAFLGETSEQSARAAHQALAELRDEPFSVEISGVDLFGGRRPQILFAAIRGSGPLQALHRKTVQALRSAGIPMRRERYRPHVTLARFNRFPKQTEGDRLAEFLLANGTFSAGPFDVGRFCLYRSELNRGPAIHTELACYPLTARTGP